MLSCGIPAFQKIPRKMTCKKIKNEFLCWTENQYSKMRRQQQQGKKRDEIWDELSGSSDEDDEEADFDHEERQKENQTGLLDRMEQQLGSLGLKRGKQEAAEVEGKGGKAVRMKENTNKTFDDVLWQEKSKKNRSKRRNLDEGAYNLEEETYTKLIAFSEAVKKISLLVRIACYAVSFIYANELFINGVPCNS
jgi:hypothetical protein